MLKKHLKGNPEISLQYFCFQEVVMEDRKKPQNHQYAPVLLNAKRGRVGQKAPSSPQHDLIWAHQVTIRQQLGCASPRSLPAFKYSPSQGFKTSVRNSPSPSQAVPTPSTSSRTFGSSLATGDVLEGNWIRGGERKHGAVGNSCLQMLR